jgi:putative membrane protein
MKIATGGVRVMGLAILLAAASCEEDAGSGTTAGGAMSEPQIAGVMLEVNQGEIAAAELARLRSMDPQVQSFASRMMAEHSAGNERLRALALTLNMDPADSGMRRQLSGDVDDDLDRLWAADRASFDKLYLQNQVDMHAEVQSLLDQTLIPSAQAPALKADLQATRSTVAVHWQEARDLLAARP